MPVIHLTLLWIHGSTLNPSTRFQAQSAVPGTVTEQLRGNPVKMLALVTARLHPLDHSIFHFGIVESGLQQKRNIWLC